MSEVDQPIERDGTRAGDGFEGGADLVIDSGIGAPVIAGGASVRRAPIPFVWQYDTRVLLLDDDNDGWVMAELRFDPEICRYQEVRRARYRLTREAIGAVLSRALASGDHAAVDTALQLHDWLFNYYGIAVVPDIIASPDASSIEFSV